MPPLQETNERINQAYTNVYPDETKKSNDDSQSQFVIEMRGDDTIQVQMSVDSARALAALSPRITITFHNVSKVIHVPAKMIDPSSKERFIQ
ncbi:unnamed protein product [Rotaria sp. Silwood1]|nr:unnamed protein product [Rotaria sp. Silwood1]CAF0972220.1 unnamed protein product [Rotaria sp. Silwood1]CAF3393579.1 unnamed protein product [Rotaria sp. Silwood1]CAF3410448.1 unnamed protein product [Rotaria sp. Silwood1]CAF4597106.1 unnamed protein product [Rotaria sp. Silwood1]